MSHAQPDVAAPAAAPGPIPAASGERAQRFARDLDALTVADPAAKRSQLWIRLGITAMVVGVALPIIAYFLSHNTSDPLVQREVGELLSIEDEMQEAHGIDPEIFRNAEFTKSILDGFDPSEFQSDLEAAGFVDVDYREFTADPLGVLARVVEQAELDVPVERARLEGTPLPVSEDTRYAPMHHVRDDAGKVVYEGETIYAWDPQRKLVAWRYFSAAGFPPADRDFLP